MLRFWETFYTVISPWIVGLKFEASGSADFHVSGAIACKFNSEGNLLPDRLARFSVRLVNEAPFKSTTAGKSQILNSSLKHSHISYAKGCRKGYEISEEGKT